MFTLFEVTKRLLLAFILGGIIGMERERKKRTAGLRTHVLVCSGSALIMLVSLYMYELYKGKVPLDPARIAAGVVTGIGFLGAGAIIRNPENVRGLTTAASIWISSAIGLAVGCGFYEAAFVGSLVSFLVLTSLKVIEKKIEK